MPEREVKKIAAEMLRPMNQGLITVGAAVNFVEYVESTYIPTVLPLLAKTTQDSYVGALSKHLKPAFCTSCLRDLSPLALQRYFSDLGSKGVAHPTMVKVRDALSSILRSAVRYGFLVKDPLNGLQLPPDKRGRRPKPFTSPAQFSRLVELIPEPYATMVYVAVWTGLRVSELIGLKWRSIHADSMRLSNAIAAVTGQLLKPKPARRRLAWNRT